VIDVDPRALPSGTVTFFFTDIEGSTTLVRELGAGRFGDVLDLHGRILRSAVREHGGNEVRTEGDSFLCVFVKPSGAVAAAAAAQRTLAATPFPHDAVVRVRMGLHTGEGALATSGSGADYVGFEVHRAARIASSGHGGQVLVSETTRTLVQDALPSGVTLRDLGEHRFKDLTRPERVFQLLIDGLPGDFPRLRSLDRTPNNLPTPLTSFVGREREVAEGRRLLAATRLLTLTGPGGTGKTRLSLQIAAASADEFPGGVTFVPLASIVSPELVLPSVAHELGLALAGQRPPLEALVEHLSDKRVLLVLDNFEQLLPAAADVAELLRQAPGTKVLASSRAPLRVYGEQELPVPPLALPDATTPPDRLSQFEAVRLFMERAVATKPGFAVTNENAPAVAGICARLDGLPLAIELAAARVRLFPPQVILARIEKSLSFLSISGAGARDLPARQQTLRGAIAWSYDLLDERVRRLFRLFACFAGGAHLDEIEAVCGAEEPVLDGLQALVEHSLVRQREDADEPRFFMLQTIREYAEERLAEDPDASEVRRRHTEAYRALAEGLAPTLMGPERKTSLDRLQREIDNFRAAIAWAIGAGATETGLRLGAALWRFLQMRGYLIEAHGELERILAMPGAAEHGGRYAAALEAAAGIAYWRGDVAATQAHYAGALAIWRALGDEREIANATFNLSFGAWMEDPGNADAAAILALLGESAAIYRRLGDKRGLAKSLWATADVQAFIRKDYDVARATSYEALALFREVNDAFGLGWNLHQIGSFNIKSQNLEAARRELEEGLALFAKAGDVTGLVVLIGDFARLSAASGDLLRGVRLAGAAAAMQRKSGANLAKIVDELEGTVDSSRHPSPEEAAAAWAAGQAMSVDEAIAEARALPALAATAASPARAS
jgi:predicted ATPase/class 3 adenylate cyclase